jgi:F-type H+-transporting ATPase subunit alpha
LRDFLEFLNKHRTLDALKAGKLTDEITDVIQTVAKNFSKI